MTRAARRLLPISDGEGDRPKPKAKEGGGAPRSTPLSSSCGKPRLRGADRRTQRRRRRSVQAGCPRQCRALARRWVPGLASLARNDESGSHDAPLTIRELIVGLAQKSPALPTPCDFLKLNSWSPSGRPHNSLNPSVGRASDPTPRCRRAVVERRSPGEGYSGGPCGGRWMAPACSPRASCAGRCLMSAPRRRQQCRRR